MSGKGHDSLLFSLLFLKSLRLWQQEQRLRFSWKGRERIIFLGCEIYGLINCLSCSLCVRSVSVLWNLQTYWPRIYSARRNDELAFGWTRRNLEKLLRPQHFINPIELLVHIFNKELVAPWTFHKERRGERLAQRFPVWSHGFRLAARCRATVASDGVSLYLRVCSVFMKKCFRVQDQNQGTF